MPSFLIKKEEDADKCWTSSQGTAFVAWRGFSLCKSCCLWRWAHREEFAGLQRGKKSIWLLPVVLYHSEKILVGNKAGKAFLGVCRVLICTKGGLSSYFFCFGAENPFPWFLLAWLQQEWLKQVLQNPSVVLRWFYDDILFPNLLLYGQKWLLELWGGSGVGVGSLELLRGFCSKPGAQCRSAGTLLLSQNGFLLA